MVVEQSTSGDATKDKLLTNEEGCNKKDESKEKTLTLIKSISMMFGSIIGSGIFISVSATFDVFADCNFIPVILIWTIGGVFAMLGSLCYAELGSRYQTTGGESVYYKEALSPKLSTLFTIMYVFVVKTITIAALSLTGAKYLVSSFDFTWAGDVKLVTNLVAVTIILICLIINLWTKKVACDMSVVFLFIKLFAVFLILGAGIYSLCAGGKFDWGSQSGENRISLPKLSTAFVNILWSYEGWNSLGLLAGDIQNPGRNIFLSSLIGVLAVIASYLFTVTSYTLVLGFNVVRTSETVALTVAKNVYGRYYPIMGILITLSTMGSVSGTLYSLGGVCSYSALNGMIPRCFALITRKGRTPAFSFILIAALSVMFTYMDFQSLLRYCSFVTWAFYFLTFFCLCKVKYAEPKRGDFHIHYVFIVVMMLGCLFMIVSCFFDSLVGCSIIAALMILIVLVQCLPFNISNWWFVRVFSDCFNNLLINLFGLEFESK